MTHTQATTGQIVVTRIESADDREAAYAIRREVFIDEQRVPAEEEFDDHDPAASHVLASVDGQPAGTGRIYYYDDIGRIGRMAVRAPFRRFGVGSAILIRLIELARERGVATLLLHAQTQAMPFYESLGFRAHGGVFDEAGIPHREMTRATGRIETSSGRT